MPLTLKTSDCAAGVALTVADVSEAGVNGALTISQRKFDCFANMSLRGNPAPHGELLSFLRFFDNQLREHLRLFESISSNKHPGFCLSQPAFPL